MKLSSAELDRIGFPYVLEHIPVQSTLGEEKKRTLVPCASLAELEIELSLVDWALAQGEKQRPAMNRLLQELMLLKDVGGSIRHLDSGELELQELFALKGFALRLLGIGQSMEEMPPVPEPLRIDSCPEVLEILDPDHTMTPSFALRDGWSEALAAIRKEKRGLEKQIEQAKPGAEKEALLVLRTEVVAREETEERQLCRRLTAALRPYKERLEDQRQKLGKLDLVLGKAAMAESFHGVRPHMGGNKLTVVNIRSPQMEEQMKKVGRSFTPLTMELPRGICVLTGANMGGKSVALRTLALGVLMAHCGLYVCAERAEIPFFQNLCLIGGDMEDAQRGLSSFGGELMSVQQAAEATERGSCLCLFDEFARGTNPFEGARIQRGVAVHFRARGVYCVFVTHYDGVSELADVCYRTRGLKKLPPQLPSMTSKERLHLLQTSMDYGLEQVDKKDPVPREALHVAELMGLDTSLLESIQQEYK